MTLVTGKRRSLLTAGDGDEVYDKKPQRYAEDNFRRRFWHETHDCVAPYVDIILHRGWF